MKFKKIPIFFKKRKDKLKKIGLGKRWLGVLILAICGILMVGFLQVYLIKTLIERKTEKVPLGEELRPTVEMEKISPKIFTELKESGVERFFLSEVKFIDYYVPTVYQCLFSKDGSPLHPNYIYATWSVLYYPENPPYKIALVRFLLLKKDNQRFQPNKFCYLKEIKTNKEWQELSEEYGFFRDRF